ncbi:hypothetical protein RCOM_0996800 [Ricinus communis]|uniref:TF-B3 domain-containing protein n=1 Tax=Ricinus communis TaxID=3988 RepID=B9T231_RICCO|nr:hypothetical protein RCOM_0996800 [Ricinus communis]
MASCSKQDNERLMFKTNRPHFFKVVLPQTIRERKLEGLIVKRIMAKEASLVKNKGNNKKLTQGKRVRREHVEKPSYSALSGEVEAAEKFTSLHPFFKLVLTSSCVKGGGLNVPKNFIMDMKPRTYETNFQVKNRWWPVRLNIYLRHSRGKFSAGWILFARENSLQAGDVCIFELIDRETMLIKVSIFRRVKQLV